MLGGDCFGMFHFQTQNVSCDLEQAFTVLGLSIKAGQRRSLTTLSLMMLSWPLDFVSSGTLCSSGIPHSLPHRAPWARFWVSISTQAIRISERPTWVSLEDQVTRATWLLSGCSNLQQFLSAARTSPACWKWTAPSRWPARVGQLHK